MLAAVNNVKIIINVIKIIILIYPLFLARSAMTCSEAGGSLKGSAECCFNF